MSPTPIQAVFRCFAAVILLGVSVPLLAQTTILVPDDYATIQEAINAAVDGDEIIVSPGTYSAFNFNGKNVVLRSTDIDDPTVVESTIIDGANAMRCIVMAGTETEDCQIAGFTIQRGLSSTGGGIFGNGCEATIINNRIIDCIIVLNPIADNNFGAGLLDCDGLIENNYIARNAGAVYCGGLALCDGIIRGNIIEENTSVQYGAGLYNCQAEITDNIIRGNSATRAAGGGMFECDGPVSGNVFEENSSVNGGAVSNCDGTFENNIFRGNTASIGAGMNRCSGRIQNNLFINNEAASRGGAMFGCQTSIFNNTFYGNSAGLQGGALASCAPATIKNCIAWGNTPDDVDSLSATPTYSCLNAETLGGGSINADPGFADPENDDFHLTDASPCIDAGGNIADLSVDLDGNARPYDGGVSQRGDGSGFDMGAYEFQDTVEIIASGWMAY